MPRTKTCLRKTLPGVPGRAPRNILGTVREPAPRQRRRRRGQTQSIRKSQQCVSNTLQRRQCRKRTAHSQKCWIHLGKEDNLRIKPSNIPNAGKGLYAFKKPFQAHKKIAKFSGRRLTKQELDRKYGEGLAEYAICDAGNCIDANYTTDAPARFANDPRGSRFRQNSRLKGRGRTFNFYLKSSKRIRPGQEILAKYGRDYWQGR